MDRVRIVLLALVMGCASSLGAQTPKARVVEFRPGVIYGGQVCDEAQALRHQSSGLLPLAGPVDIMAVRQYASVETAETIACEHLKVELLAFDAADLDLKAAKTPKEKKYIALERDKRRTAVHLHVKAIRETLNVTGLQLGRVLEDIERAIP